MSTRKRIESSQAVMVIADLFMPDTFAARRIHRAYRLARVFDSHLRLQMGKTGAITKAASTVSPRYHSMICQGPQSR